MICECELCTPKPKEPFIANCTGLCPKCKLLTVSGECRVCDTLPAEVEEKIKRILFYSCEHVPIDLGKDLRELAHLARKAR